MNLTTGPLLRVHVVTVAADRHVGVCSMHHAITDGWSVGVLLNDVAALYDAQLAGAGGSLPPLPIQYRDYAVWEHEVAAGPVFEAMRRHWHQTFDGGVPALSLPADLAAAPGTFTRAESRVVIGRDLVETLEGAARAHGATLFMALLSCIKVLLFRHSAQEHVCVGTPVAARAQPELEAQIGPYLNILALADHIRAEDSLTGVLHHVRETTLAAFANQLFPFDLLVQELRLTRVAGRNPLFDVGFTLQNQIDVQARDTSRRIRITPLEREADAFDDPEAATDLWFVGRRDEGDLVLQVVYNGARFSAQRVEGWLNDLQTIVSVACTRPETRVAAVPLAASDHSPASRPITIDLGL